jgi:hypothetical protein
MIFERQSNSEAPVNKRQGAQSILIEAKLSC